MARHIERQPAADEFHDQEHLPVTEPDQGREKLRREAEPLMQRLSAKALRPVKMAMLLGMLMAGKPGLAAEQEMGQPTATTSGEMLPMRMQETDPHAKNEYRFEGAHFTFLRRAPNGQIEFHPDWRSLIAPVQVEFSREQQREWNHTFDIPYEYSRLFDTGAPLRTEDHERLANYVDLQLKRELADNLHGLNFNKEVFRSFRGDDKIEGVELKDMHVVGTASPEGPAERGPETLKPGAVDVENETLARLRAMKGGELTLEQLQHMGVNVAKLERSAENIRGEELQFSDQEYHDLQLLADWQGYPGTSGPEVAYNFVRAYNEGHVKNANDIHFLNKHVGAKRMVQVELDYGGKKKDTLLLPIPLILGLLPFLRRRRGNRSAADQVRADQALEGQRSGLQEDGVAETPEVTGEQVSPMTEQVDVATGKKTFSVETWREALPSLLRETSLPNTESTEFQDMEERTYIDDLYVYLDDPEEVRRGIDYRVLAERLAERYDAFDSDEERELWATQIVLHAWRERDRRARQEAGVSADQLNVGLDYDNQPHQVRWAKMHARALRELVSQQQATPERDYADVLALRARVLHQRRITRARRNTPTE